MTSMTIIRSVFLTSRCLPLLLLVVATVLVGHATTGNTGPETETDTISQSPMASLGVNSSCSTLRLILHVHRLLPDIDLPHRMISGEHLQVCPGPMTCCTLQAETMLANRSRAHFDAMTSQRINAMRQALAIQAAKFDEYVENLLMTSQRDLNRMFTKTYGQLYEQHSALFADLFTSLKNFYRGRAVGAATPSNTRNAPVRSHDNGNQTSSSRLDVRSEVVPTDNTVYKSNSVDDEMEFDYDFDADHILEDVRDMDVTAASGLSSDQSNYSGVTPQEHNPSTARLFSNTRLRRADVKPAFSFSTTKPFLPHQSDLTAKLFLPHQSDSTAKPFLPHHSSDNNNRRFQHSSRPSPVSQLSDLDANHSRSTVVSSTHQSPVINHHISPPTTKSSLPRLPVEINYHISSHTIKFLAAVRQFFVTLMTRMLTLMHSEYELDSKFLNCTQQNFDELAPFGDVPVKLTTQLRRSLSAARALVRALREGGEILQAIGKLPPSDRCRNEFARLTQCPLCGVVPGVRPCIEYCVDTMSKCLEQPAELGQAWNEYIDELLKVVGRLEGPFNIEHILQPINVKISDAIMHLQENAETMSTKIFDGCGQPKLLNREKRQTTRKSLSVSGHSPGVSSLSDRQPVDVSLARRGKPVTSQSSASTSLSTLDKLIKDVRDKMEPMKDFWLRLPSTMCRELTSSTAGDDNCWNGLDLKSNSPNTSFLQDSKQTVVPSAVQNVLQRIRQVAERLRGAHSGLDVDWPSTDELDEYPGSGSDDDFSGDSEEASMTSGNDVISIPVTSTNLEPGTDNDEISFTTPVYIGVELITRDGPDESVSPSSESSRITSPPFRFNICLVLFSVFVCTVLTADHSLSTQIITICNNCQILITFVAISCALKVLDFTATSLSQYRSWSGSHWHWQIS